MCLTYVDIEMHIAIFLKNIQTNMNVTCLSLGENIQTNRLWLPPKKKIGWEGNFSIFRGATHSYVHKIEWLSSAYCVTSSWHNRGAQ